MTQFTRTSMIAAVLVASLSAPVAFAQDATTTQEPPTAQAEAGVEATAAQDATATGTAGADVTTEKKSWADVDTDKDGNLTKAEAGSVPALGDAFDKADANADGSLTADEYKAYIAAAKGGDAGGNGDGGATK